MRAATPVLVLGARVSWPLRRVWMIAMIWRRGRRSAGTWGLGSGGGAQQGGAGVVEVGFELFGER